MDQTGMGLFAKSAREATARRGISMKIGLVFLLLTGSCTCALSQTLADNLSSPELWRPDHVPFSFKYAGRDSAELLKTWQTESATAAGTEAQVRLYSYIDPATNLVVTAEVRHYAEFPGVVDWVLRFRNNGSSDSPILEDILPLDSALQAAPGNLLIRHAKGSDANAEDFMPMMERLEPGKDQHFEPEYGRSSSGMTLPFFNLQTGDHGLIEAIGWSGNWRADFSIDREDKTIRLASGMKQTHFLLHPGEEIRTPRIVLMSWTGGDWQQAQNSWRRLLFAHYTPRDNGKPMRGPVLFGGWGSEPIADKLAYIKWVHDNKIPVDVFAVDAGWYGDSVGAETDPTNPWWKNRGDWFPSQLYYPHGIKPLGDALKAAGIGFSLWIEPETTMAGKKIARDHPDWFIDRPKEPWTHGELQADLGNPAARQGLTNMVSDLITDFGMTWYRQDFNHSPENYWKAADTPDRVGINEIGHIEGLYKMWDDLLARHPGLHIDNCASGGRRLDIEMMSRSFSVWRTDYGFTDTLAEQAQTQALAYWVPENMGFETYSMEFEGHSVPWTHPGPYSTPESLYLMRLGYSAGFGVGPGAAGVNNEAWVSWIKQGLAEYREVQPYIYGDFYPLLPYSRDAESWTAWQWDRPEMKDGLIMLLRRPLSPFPLFEVRPKHLDPAATYDVEIRTSYEHAHVRQMKGSDLSHLQIQLSYAPSSTLIFYRKR
jgi:alpha-galactosidase